MNIVYARQPLPDMVNGKVPKSLFLIGPTPRYAALPPLLEPLRPVLKHLMPRYVVTPSWRPEALRILHDEFCFDGTVFVPEDEQWGLSNVIYHQQTQWEIAALGASQVRMVWIPRELVHMPAFTTNTEYGFAIAFDPDSVVLGCPLRAKKVAYQKQLGADIALLHKVFEPDMVRRFGTAPLAEPTPFPAYQTLWDTLEAALEKLAA